MSSADDAGLTALGAREATRRIREGKLSPVELMEACLERVRALEPRLRAWFHVDEAGALHEAREREATARRGLGLGLLHGVPVGIKDIIDVAGMPTTAGAAPWAHRRPTADATSVARLRAAGAIVLGKTATTQFAYRDPAPTRNPWNLAHTPGGSSAGSAAAVAARMVSLATGSQTVGSVIRPAAYCGVVGVKGTCGLVPLDGVVPLAWSLDHVGVFARSVDDAALGLGVLAARDFAAAPADPPRLALAPELLERADPGVAAAVQEAAAALARAGARVGEVRLPASFAEIHAAGQVVLEAEAAAYHQASFGIHAAAYGPGIRAGVEAGLAHPATRYVQANRARLQFRAEILPLLDAWDAVLSPAAPTPAPAGLGSTGDGSLCAPWTFTGVPAVTLPIGLAASGLPHALQLAAAAGHDASLLRVAAWCERHVPFTATPAL
jgi:aspartyl-tRNA(Asn)/glutamyl-tRNA(Gln) amidotransferase subunit A